jgi:hypothetical protein
MKQKHPSSMGLDELAETLIAVYYYIYNVAVYKSTLSM